MGRTVRQAQLEEIRAGAAEFAGSTRDALFRIREARVELSPPSNLLAFVHIPKCAGGTVINMFAAAYTRPALYDAGNYMTGPEGSTRKVARRQGGWQQWESRGGRVTYGHVPYGVYRQFLPRGSRYMTFLREPVDRVLTHYYNHVRLKDPRSHRQRQPDDRPSAFDPRIRTATMEEAFEMRLPVLCNLATRFLCGHPSPLQELPDNALDAAKANLRDFAFVGLQERFEESIVLLQRMLGLPMTTYVNRHVSVGRPAVEEIGEEERRLILEQNQLDVELYAFGKQLFEKAVASTDDGFTADAERFRAMSEDANEDAIRRAREMLDRELPVGASKPKAELFATAQRTGVSGAALKNASRAGILKHREDGERVWTRTD